MFCMQHHDIEPDLITMAKGIAGGYPIAAVVGKIKFMDSPLPGGLGGTYAGSPVACAASLAVLDIIEEEKLINKANQIGEQFSQRLQAMQKELVGVIGDIRINGAMIAIELVKKGDANQPDAELTKKIVSMAYEKGLVLLSCGSRSNVIRFLPPLTIESELIDEGLNILRDCFLS